MQAVRHSAELKRILDLPRRTPAVEPSLLNEMTSLLRADTCKGEENERGLCSVCKAPMRLRSNQALALHDIGTNGGAWIPLGVGEGKTLISLLAPYVLDAKRPVLLIPGNLEKKTLRDRELYSRHWAVSKHLWVLSYEKLALKDHAQDLDNYDPDLILCDEAHNLKNLRASRTRRVSRFMHHKPSTAFVPMSGTMMTKSLLDYGHLLTWSLKDHAPVPRTRSELEEWAAALDEDLSGRPGDELGRMEAGALLSLCNEGDLADTPIATARRGFKRRLVETPGVVATQTAERVNCSIHIRALKYDLPRSLDELFKKVRAYIAPADDYELMSGAEVWAHAKALSLGLTYVWSPRPPKDWKEARRAWGSYVRETIGRSRTWDSEAHVASAVDAGELDDGGVLAAWRKIRPTFEPNVVPVWHDDTALKLCIEWAKEPGIIWTDHAFFAERLAELSGLPYYGSEGLDAQGNFIDDANPRRAAIVSRHANKEGRNLQGIWSRNLVTSAWESAGIWEQVIGRTHRPGQQADEVTVDVLLGCREHVNAWARATALATAIRDTTGAEQKILLADTEFPDDFEVSSYEGPQW